MNKFITIVFALAISIAYVNAHAYLHQPKARQALAKYPEVPRYSLRVPGQHARDIQAMQCGFVHNSPDNLEKKCSICGEKWNGLQRLTKGGDLYRGTIQETYEQGAAINVTLKVNIYIYILFFFLKIDHN